jgi:hypothetical protein
VYTGRSQLQYAGPDSGDDPRSARRRQELSWAGVGAGLLRDAVLRTLQAAEIAGIRAILVHAISDDATRFYEKYGFVVSPVDPLTVMITVAEAVKIIAP